MPELNLHNLKINRKAKKKGKRVGRGDSSGHGTYSGRGLKGQRARSGGKGGLKRKGLMQTLKSKPKLGGFTSLKKKKSEVNLEILDKNFGAGEIVNLKKLKSKKLIGPSRGGVKILGEGKLTKKLSVYADAFSESAKKAILEAGGEVKVATKQKARNSKKPSSKK